MLKTSSVKTITLVSEADAISTKIKISGREAVIRGCRSGSDYYWMRKPIAISVNIGDEIRTEGETDFIHKIEID